MPTDGFPLLQTVLPGFYAEIIAGLFASPALREQVSQLTVESYGSNPDSFTIEVGGTRALNIVEQNVIKPRYAHSLEVEMDCGIVVVDLDNFGRIMRVEIIGRPEVYAQLVAHFDRIKMTPHHRSDANGGL